jgi:hypothetical protein
MHRNDANSRARSLAIEASLLLVLASAASGAVFQVDTTADTVDASAGRRGVSDLPLHVQAARTQSHLPLRLG